MDWKCGINPPSFHVILKTAEEHNAGYSQQFLIVSSPMQRVFIPLECHKGCYWDRCQRNDSRDNTNPQTFDQSSINEEFPRLFSALSGALSVMSDQRYRADAQKLRGYGSSAPECYFL